MIRQSDDQLSIHYEPGDGTWDVRYALDQREGAPRNTGTWTMSRWDGSALVTRGRRRFKTHDGAEVFDFEERRTLSPDGSRLTLVTRIDMFPKDLVRTSTYARVPADRPEVAPFASGASAQRAVTFLSSSVLSAATPGWYGPTCAGADHVAVKSRPVPEVTRWN